MPRKKRKNLKRIIAPDDKYKSSRIAKFINRVMLGGKKRIAEKIVYDSIETMISGIEEKDAVKAFEQLIKNVTPLMEVKSRRVGGSTYQVPMEVRPDRGITLAMRWIINNARSRSGNSMVDRLSSELMDAYNNNGQSVKKREDTHKMAEANKAFAHFRW
jgi:small subunit ribosomal protein S7